MSAEKLFERVINYAVSIVEGEILASIKHKRACQRFIADLNLIGSDGYPYEFDIDELENFYEWAKLFKHSKGVLQGQPIELTDFQLFICANIFCWKFAGTNNRRIKKVYIQLARKNAKSQLLALIGSYITFLSEETEECYIAGWGREQSSLVYNEIVGQIAQVELLKNKYTTSYGMIKVLKRGSIIKPLSKESRKTGDGTNPSVAILDEYHAHETSEIYDVLVSGMVARKNPLTVIITTAGFNLSAPCYVEYNYVSSILDPDSEITNDEYFVMICELDPDDDIKDEKNWIKANPIVATYKEGIASLRSALQTALDVPEKMRSFLTKNVNKWVSMRDNGYMDLAKWRSCADPKLTLEDMRGKECYIGVDLSAKIDLTSVSFEFPIEDKFFVFGHSFIPEETLQAKMKTDKVPYDLWVNQGWITLTDGGVVDYNFVRIYIERMIEKYGIIAKEICSDPWNSTQFMTDLESEGFEVVEVRQAIGSLGAPTKHFREEVYKGNVVHNDNPVINWAVENAVTRMDAQENIMLDKSKSTQRIDPLACIINSHVRGMLRMINIKSVYENSGIRIL